MRSKTRNTVYCAMIAAVYTTLCLALAPIGYGPMQFRVSEALTLLPVFSMTGVWGVTLGCALANLVGFFTGANILGYMDIFFGTAATFFAALLSRSARNIRIGGIPVLSALPPVALNAVVIGAELSWVLGAPGSYMQMFWLNAAQVGAGQLAACVALGLPLVYALEKTGVAGRYLVDEAAGTFRGI